MLAAIVAVIAIAACAYTAREADTVWSRAAIRACLRLALLALPAGKAHTDAVLAAAVAAASANTAAARLTFRAGEALLTDALPLLTGTVRTAAARASD